MAVQKYVYPEFSGALQQRTTVHIKKPNEVVDAGNANFDKVLGAITRRDGAQSTVASMPSLPVSNPTLGAFIARYPTGSEIWAINNIAGNATSTLKRWVGPGVGTWSDVQTGMLANAETNFLYDLEEVWVSQYRVSDDTMGAPFTVDSSHSVSTTRQLQFGPQARFFTEFNGAIFAANATVGGVRYRDRLYKSSGPTGVITFTRNAQLDTLSPITLVDQVPTMTTNTTPLGVAAASAFFDAPRDAFAAFNDDLGTYWITTSGTVTGTISYDFGSGVTKIITYYSMVGPWLGEANPNVAPKTWTFEGSNNGSSWTVLDTETAVPVWVAGEKRTYSTSNTTAYRYYRINVSANQGNTSFLEIAEIELLVSTSAVKSQTMLLDSVRYIKPGMVIDFYTAGTNTLLFSITVNTVDKANDSITFIPFTLNFVPGDVTTGTDLITLSSATAFPTGTPIKFNTTIGLPAPLIADTTYYAINISPTTIKVATNLINAQSGVPIDLTTTGSGVHGIRLTYAVGNKDELWGSGRKGKLTRYWNTDYKNPEDSDYLKLPATLDGATDITAVGSISGRLFPFTENAMFKYDGQNLTTLKRDVGCIAHKSIAYYDTFMVWLDGKGQVWLRNEEAGTTDVISIPVQKTLRRFTQAQLRAATAVCVGYMYKLTVGVDAEIGLTCRLTYNFLSNQWSKEWFTAQMPVQLEYLYSGLPHPHWFDEVGQMWVDEQGDDDNGSPIPFDVTFGDDTFGVDEIKNFLGAKIYSDNVAGTKIVVRIDGGDPYDVGELTQSPQVVRFPKIPKGTMINIRVEDSTSTGTAVSIEKAVVYYVTEEDTIRATAKS